MLREHQLVTLILSFHDSKTRSKAKLAPPASFTRPLARRPPFSMGMIAWASLVGQLPARREGDVPLAHGGAHGGAGGPRSHLLGRPSCERAFFPSAGCSEVGYLTGASRRLTKASSRSTIRFNRRIFVWLANDTLRSIFVQSLHGATVRLYNGRTSSKYGLTQSCIALTFAKSW